MLLLLVLSILIICSFVHLFYKNKFERIECLTKAVPTPAAWPIIGHAQYFINKTPNALLLAFRDLIELHGETFKFWIGPECNIYFGDVKDVEAVLSSTKINDKSDHYVFLDSWLCEGLLVSRGKKWFQRRKILTPAFHFKILEQFIEIFERESRYLVDNLRKAAMHQSAELGVHIYDLVKLCTLDTICETAMGVSINAQHNADSAYVRAVETITTVLHKRMFDIFYRFNLTYMWTSLAREEKRALKVLHDFTEKIIVQRREELLKEQQQEQAKDEQSQEQQQMSTTNTAADIKCKGNSNVSSTNDTEVGAKRKMALLDLLLQSQIDGKPLTNLDIREEVDTFMFEGHDTTSAAINFFFFEIATHPISQYKCFEELSMVFGNDKTIAVTQEHLNKLHYLELCIKETLRMFPSVPLLGRKVTQDCEINGKIIPRGINVAISPLALGRNPELFEDPNSFIPERFDVVTSASKLNPYGYIPFSAGPRNCIGQKFAMLEMKCIIANVLRHFEFEYIGDPNEELPLQSELILHTEEPLMFRIKQRVY